MGRGNERNVTSKFTCQLIFWYLTLKLCDLFLNVQGWEFRWQRKWETRGDGGLKWLHETGVLSSGQVFPLVCVTVSLTTWIQEAGRRYVDCYAAEERNASGVSVIHLWLSLSSSSWWVLHWTFGSGFFFFLSHAHIELMYSCLKILKNQKLKKFKNEKATEKQTGKLMNHRKAHSAGLLRVCAFVSVSVFSRHAISALLTYIGQ